MSLLVIRKNTRRLRRWILAYLVIAAFTAIFGVIYESFSHEVYSAYMMYAFCIPLAGGALPALLLLLFSRRTMPGKFVFNVYNSGIAALTVGCIFQGVLEIYGTTNRLISIYWIAGGVLTALGVGLYILALVAEGRKKRRKGHPHT